MTVEVPLTGGRVAIVDDEDADLVKRYRWQAMQGGGGGWYAVRRTQAGPGRKQAQLMHQLLTGWPLTDHINGDGLDNRRANLRQATHAQNIQNSRKRRNAGSRYKGVYLDGRSGYWVAQIYIPDRTRTPPKQQIRLGRRFSSEEEAARAYDEAARLHFGEFAALNFPLPGERGCRDDTAA